MPQLQKLAVHLFLATGTERQELKTLPYFPQLLTDTKLKSAGSFAALFRTRKSISKEDSFT